MCDATFTFGQRGSHFLQCPSRREISRLPRQLSALLGSSQLQHIHHVTLGFEDSFLITWRDTRGQDHVDSAGLPAELTNFLYARNSQRQLIRNIPEIRCSLGPYNASFFAHDTAAYLWMDIPPRLLSALESRIKNGGWTDPPRLVALGAASSFVLITAEHAAVWSLSSYPALSKIVDNAHRHHGGIKDLHNMTLHPYRYAAFIVQYRSGALLHENPPPHAMSAVRAMAEPIQQDTRKAELRAQRRAERKAERLASEQAQAQRDSASREREMPRSRRSNLQQRPSSSTLEREVRPRTSSSNLQQRTQTRREWSEHKQQFTAQNKGLKLSLSLSISAGGLGRMLG